MVLEKEVDTMYQDMEQVHKCTYMHVGLVHHWIDQALEASDQIANHITAYPRPLHEHALLELLKDL